MSRPLPGQSVPASPPSPIAPSRPIISPLEKALKAVISNEKNRGFGIIDRKTLEMCACYRDSVKYSIYALIGTFIGLVILILVFNF